MQKSENNMSLPTFLMSQCQILTYVALSAYWIKRSSNPYIHVINWNSRIFERHSHLWTASQQAFRLNFDERWAFLDNLIFGFYHFFALLLLYVV